MLALAGCARLKAAPQGAEAAAQGSPSTDSAEVVQRVFSGTAALTDPTTGPVTAAAGPVVSAEQALAIAYQRNPTFEEYAANLDAARAEVIQATAYPNPSLDADAGMAVSRADGKGAAEYGIRLSQPIELPAKRKARRAAAEASKGVVESEREAFRAQLRAEVLKAYYAALFHQRAAAVAEETARIAREIEAIVRKRMVAGEAAGVDRLKAEVELRQAARAVELQQRKRAAYRSVLNALCGRALPPEYILAGTLRRDLGPADLEQAEAIALARHPSVARLNEELNRQRLVLVREQKEWYPDLVPSLGFSREIDTTKAGGSLGFELPLWNRNQGGIAAAQAELRRLEAELERTRLEVLRDVEVEYQNYESAREQLAALEKGLRSTAAESLKIETFRYNLGESGLLDLLDARRTAQVTEAEYVQALYDLNVARAELERAIGLGGEAR
jgi:cobalt-zinc-cadmium efflux system outer membrane protein